MATSIRDSAKGFPAVPLEMEDGAEHRRQLAASQRQMLQGKLNVTDTVTLTNSAATTTITDTRIGVNTVVILNPTVALASAEIGAGAIYQTYPNATKHQAVINHANNSNTRTFAVVYLG